QQRTFADEKKPDETLVPGSASQLAPQNVPPPPTLSPTNPASPTSAPENIPKTPPPPPAQTSSNPASNPAPTPIPPTGTGTASTSSAPPPPPPKKPRRLRNFILALFILTALGYGGGAWYAMRADNFHDFFTEYVPFGEDIVGFLEEREFRKRFPGGTGETRLHPQIRGEGKVTIPGRGGVRPHVADEPSRRTSDLGAVGSHMSAVDSTAAKQTPGQASGAERSQAQSKSSTGKATQPAPGAPQAESKPAPAPEPAKSTASASQIDHLNVPSAEEPIVQDVVKILNDIIAVVNADNAAGKYNSTIAKAKADLGKVVSNIETLKAVQVKAAEDKIRDNHTEFDNAAKELIQRLENEMKDQEARWKDEYEAEREKLSKAYESKLESELNATKQFFDQKLQNELLEQAIAMRKEFNTTVRDRVETERSSRLGKLDELSAGVKELEKLTGEWNSVVDSNLQTQHLLVAVESVRATLLKADGPKPFITELAALKEVANDDPVINAAIASINPTAYQRGIPTPAQLIDRFRRVSTEIRKAALLPENAGIASHMVSYALSKFMFKKSGLPVGQDVESVLARTEMWLEEGDLDAAAREINGLQGWAKVISRDWLSDCRKVLEVQQALDVIATEARLQSLLVE
ncbi:hypothetical protein NA57DRAFT_32811, partial [Rhizodiscina lignyota]